MRRSKVLGGVAMLLLLSAVLFPSATQAREAGAVTAAVSTISQFYFRAGSSGGSILYFETLRACGYNSSNAYICWTTKTYPAFTRNADWISGTGVQPSRGVTFYFFLSGYGNRQCTVYPASTNNYYIDYAGNNACTSRAY